MMSRLSQLTVVQTDSTVKVTNADGRVLASYAARSAGNSANTDRPSPAAQWQGNNLVVTMQGRGGGTTTRTFELSPDGKQLYMINKIDNPRLQQPVTIRLVYDPAKSSE